MLGIVYAILAAATLALNGATFRRGAIYGSAVQGVYVTILGGMPLFLIAAVATGQLFRTDELGPAQYGVLAAAGLLHFLFGRYSNFRAVAAIGQNRTQPLVTASTLVSVGIAMAFLDEVLTLLMGIGIVLVLIGPALAISRGTGEREAGRSVGAAVAAGVGAPPARLVEGYLWGSLSALAFGTSPILIRYALSDSGLGVLGGTVAYAAAALVLVLSLGVPGRVGALRGMSADARRWFAFGTVTVFVAHMFRFLALSLAPVSVVIPLMRGGAVFSVFFAFLINREHESFDRRVLTGIAISITGALAMVI